MPSLEKIKNKGVSTKEAGSIWVIKKISTKIFIPLTLYLASPYAAGTDRQRASAMEPIAMITEFFNVTDGLPICS